MPPNKGTFLSASTSCPSLKDKLSAASGSPSGLLLNGSGGVSPFTALLERVPEVVDSACSTPPLASPTSSVGGAAARRAGGGGGVTAVSKQQPLGPSGDRGGGDGLPSELFGGGSERPVVSPPREGGGGGVGSLSNGIAAAGGSDGGRAPPGSTDTSPETAAAGGGGDATAVAAPVAVGGDGGEDDAMDGNENRDPRAAANKTAALGRAGSEDGVVVVAAPTTTVRAKSPHTRQAAAEAAAAERQCQARPTPPGHGAAAAGAQCEEGRGGGGGNRGGEDDVDGDVPMPSGAALSLTPAFSPGGDRTSSRNAAEGAPPGVAAGGGGWKGASPTNATSGPSPSPSSDGRRNGRRGRNGVRAGGSSSALAGGARATGSGSDATAAAAAPGPPGGATSNPFLKPDFVIKICLTLYKVRRLWQSVGPRSVSEICFLDLSVLQTECTQTAAPPPPPSFACCSRVASREVGVTERGCGRCCEFRSSSRCVAGLTVPSSVFWGRGAIMFAKCQLAPRRGEGVVPPLAILSFRDHQHQPVRRALPLVVWEAFRRTILVVSRTGSLCVYVHFLTTCPGSGMLGTPSPSSPRCRRPRVFLTSLLRPPGFIAAYVLGAPPPPCLSRSRQVQNQIYLLDFQKLEGDPFGFMSLCSQVPRSRFVDSRRCENLLGVLIQVKGGAVRVAWTDVLAVSARAPSRGYSHENACRSR